MCNDGVKTCRLASCDILRKKRRITAFIRALLFHWLPVREQKNPPERTGDFLKMFSVSDTCFLRLKAF
jgi:hypothetical protein